MSSKIYGYLEDIQTVLKALEDDDSNKVFGLGGSNVIIGSEFEVNTKQLPLGIIHITGGDIKNIALLDSINVHIVGICYEEIGNVTEKTLEVMEYVMKSGVKDIGGLVGPVHFTVDSDILSIFDLEFIPILAPFGGFRLDYRLSRNYYV